MGFFQSLIVVAGLAAQTFAQQTGSTFSPARPPAVPLAVRSPYLSTWLEAGSDGGNGGYLAGEWPTFWTGQVTAWTGIIKVDGLPYVFMGAPAVNAMLVNQTAFTYTSTRSTFTQNVNQQVGIIVEFFSPVLPNDTERMSLPFSYMNVQTFSMDGAAHTVELYTDISAEWVSGNRNDIAQWDYSTIAGTTASKRSINVEGAEVDLEKRGLPWHRTFGTKTAYTQTLNPRPVHTFPPYQWHPHPYPSWTHSRPGRPTHTVPTSTSTPTPTATAIGLAVHHVFRQIQQIFSENSDQALWGDLYYTTANVANLTFQNGQDSVVRGQFINNGVLANTQDTDYRAINNDWPVFAFANDLGSVTATAKSTLFTIGLLQKQAIQFEGATNQTLNAYWTNYFSTNQAAISFFYSDYKQAGTLCDAIDQKVQADSVAAASQDYATITTLSVRQAYGALQLVGTPSEMYVFLKEISSDGNAQTVDVIFPTHPILLYMSPQWLGLLLEPLFINQEAGNWPYAFSIHDLGNHYPNATGHNDGMDEMQPLEECGDMIIMTLAYAQRTNDNAFLSAHYDILRQWNEYLIEEALIPADQISTDDFAGSLANQTNLAIKGIIGIAAMAEIANRTGNIADGQNYTNIAQGYLRQWETLAIAPATTTTLAHTTLSYGNNTSYGLLYNLYADRLLSLGLVPQSVYDMQSAFYPTVALPYGVPLDTRHTWTKSDWQIFCAAIASTSTKDLFVHLIANWINVTPTNLPLTDLYDAATANYPGFDFIARPVVGGHFAILALSSAPKVNAL